MWQAIMGLLGGQSQGDIKRTDLNSKRAYYQQLMNMLQPDFKPSFNTQGQTTQGESGLGNLSSLINMLGGNNNMPQQQEYNPFNDYTNNDWNMEGYGG